MDGVWIKRCPDCGTYMKKKDPQECTSCRKCGWQECKSVFFCEFTNSFCVAASKAGRKTVLKAP